MSLTHVARPEPATKRFSAALAAVTLVLVATPILTFLPVLRNGFVNWDDDANFLENQDFRGLAWANLRWAWSTCLLDVYQPLAWMLLEVEYRVWGLQPWGYHLVSLLLHVAVCLVMVGLTIDLLERVGGEASRLSLRVASAASVLLFAVHPLRVEVVAWVSCQPYLPCALFYVLGLRAYLCAHPAGAPRRPAWLVAAFAAAAAALLSKAVALSLPVVLLVLDYYPLQRLGGRTGGWFGPSTRRACLEKLPFLALGLVFAIAAVRARGVTADLVPTAESHLTSRLAKASYGVAFYLFKTVNPSRLSVYYPPPAQLGVIRHPYSTATVIVGLVTGGVLLVARRWPGLAAVWASYVMMLAPHLTLTSGNDTKLVAERYCYVATIPWVVLLSYVLSRPALWRRRSTILSVILAIIVVLSVRSWRQCAVWGSSERLFQQALDNAGSDDPLLLNNLGAELLDRGDLHSAERCFRRVIELTPEDCGAQNNLGLVLVRHRRYAESAECFRMAIEAKPRFAEAHKNLGQALDHLGRLDDAEREFGEALKLDPGFPVAHASLASLLARRGRLEAAIAHYVQAVQSTPDQPDWQASLGTLQARQGRLDAAIASLRHAVTLRPRFVDARANLGMALMRRGESSAAEREFIRVLRQRPDQPVARKGLAELRQHRAAPKP